ncbi:MAG: Fe-S cluster assembly protein SufD [Candidatus Nanohaloarchaea archaeon]
MRLENVKEKAGKELSKLEMPESIRTPGRTWTRLPENLEELSDGATGLEPEIEIDGDVEVFTGEEAAEQAGDKLLDALKFDENRMTALHAAEMNSLVYVEASGESEVEINYNEDAATFAHLVVDARESAEVTVREYFRGSGRMTSSIGEFYVGKNASVTYGSVQTSGCGLNYVARNAVVSRDGSMEWLNSVFGADLAKQRLETVLKGDNSSTDMISAFYPTGEQHHDISMRVRHRGENTTCDMNTRGVVDDSARSAYEGLQDVGREAPGTSSFQHENTLMLSEKAEADASPKLMIDNNDVEATHAAAAGRVPEDEMHYMKSRGLSEEQARRLVVKGFFEPLMEEIELPGLKDELREQVKQKLEE